MNWTTWAPCAGNGCDDKKGFFDHSGTICFYIIFLIMHLKSSWWKWEIQKGRRGANLSSVDAWVSTQHSSPGMFGAEWSIPWMKKSPHVSHIVFLWIYYIYVDKPSEVDTGCAYIFETYSGDIQCKSAELKPFFAAVWHRLGAKIMYATCSRTSSYTRVIRIFQNKKSSLIVFDLNCIKWILLWSSIGIGLTRHWHSGCGHSMAWTPGCNKDSPCYFPNNHRIDQLQDHMSIQRRASITLDRWDSLRTGVYGEFGGR